MNKNQNNNNKHNQQKQHNNKQTHTTKTKTTNKKKQHLLIIYPIITGTKFETSFKTTPNWESTLTQR